MARAGEPQKKKGYMEAALEGTRGARQVRPEVRAIDNRSRSASASGGGSGQLLLLLLLQRGEKLRPIFYDGEGNTLTATVLTLR